MESSRTPRRTSSATAKKGDAYAASPRTLATPRRNRRSQSVDVGAGAGRNSREGSGGQGSSADAPSNLQMPQATKSKRKGKKKRKKRISINKTKAKATATAPTAATATSVTAKQGNGHASTKRPQAIQVGTGPRKEEEPRRVLGSPLFHEAPIPGEVTSPLQGTLSPVGDLLLSHGIASSSTDPAADLDRPPVAELAYEGQGAAPRQSNGTAPHDAASAFFSSVSAATSSVHSAAGGTGLQQPVATHVGKASGVRFHRLGDSELAEDVPDPADLERAATSSYEAAHRGAQTAAATATAPGQEYASVQLDFERLRLAKEELEMEQRLLKRKQARLEREKAEYHAQRVAFDTEQADVPQSDWQRLRKELQLDRLPVFLFPPAFHSNNPAADTDGGRYQPSQLLEPPQQCSGEKCDNPGCVVLCAEEIERLRDALRTLQQVTVSAAGKVVAAGVEKEEKGKEKNKIEGDEEDHEATAEDFRAVAQGGKATDKAGGQTTPEGKKEVGFDFSNMDTPPPAAKLEGESESESKSKSTALVISGGKHDGHRRAFSSQSFSLSKEQDETSHRRMKSTSFAMHNRRMSQRHRRMTSMSFFQGSLLSNEQDSSAEVVFEGYLAKKSSKRLVGWQRRYFQLFPSLLTYAAEKGGVTLSRIPIKFIQYVTVPDKGQNPEVLQMLAEVPRWGKKEFWLRADTADNAQLWEQHIWKVKQEHGRAGGPDVFILPDRRGSKKSVPFKDVVIGAAAQSLSEADLGPAESFYRPPTDETEPKGLVLLSGALKMKKPFLTGTTWAPLEAELSQHKLILYKDSVEKPCDSFSVRSLATVFRDEKEPCIFTIIKDPSIGGGTITLRAIDPPLTKKWVGLLRDAIQAARMDAESKVRTRCILQGPLMSGRRLSLEGLSGGPGKSTRWFQLFNNMLVYFKTSDVRGQPVRSYELQDLLGAWSEEESRQYLMEFNQLLQAQDDDTAIEWLNTLNKAIFKAKLVCNGLVKWDFPSANTQAKAKPSEQARLVAVPKSLQRDALYSMDDYPFWLPNDETEIVINDSGTTGETSLREVKLHKLIEWVTLPNEDHYNTRFDFLLTYTSIMTPQELADLLVQRASMPLEDEEDVTQENAAAASEWRLNEVAPVQKKVLLLIRTWLNLLVQENYFRPGNKQVYIVVTEGEKKQKEAAKKKKLEEEAKKKAEEEGQEWIRPQPETVEETKVVKKVSIDKILFGLLDSLAKVMVTKTLLHIVNIDLRNALEELVMLRDGSNNSFQSFDKAGTKMRIHRGKKGKSSPGAGKGRPHFKSGALMLSSFSRFEDKSPPPPSLLRSTHARRDQIGVEPVFDFDTVHIVELARQLALRDFHLFSRIRSTEFVHRAWQMPDKQKSARNLVKVTEHFNSLVAWVQSLILQPGSIAQHRAKRVGRLIKVAAKCQELRSYPSFFALYTALVSPQCEMDRLQMTWALVTRKNKAVFDTFHQIFNVERNHKNFRTELARAKKPTVPFVGTFLSDLFQIDESMKDMTKNGLINFHKMRLMAKTIGLLKQFQTEPFRFRRVSFIQAALDDALEHTLSDEELTERSHTLEADK